MNAAELENKLIDLVIQTKGPWRLFERGEMAFLIETNSTGFSVALEFLTVEGWIQKVPGRWLAQTTMRRTPPHHVHAEPDEARLHELIRQLLREEDQYQREHSPPQPKTP